MFFTRTFILDLKFLLNLNFYCNENLSVDKLTSLTSAYNSLAVFPGGGEGTQP